MILIDKMPLGFGRFPNGESYPKRTDNIGPHNVEIDLMYESDADLVHLMFLKKHLDFSESKSRYSHQIILLISYMPYSRQDRVEGESFFTLKYICDFINDLGFSRVIVLEPHSEVTSALLNNAYAVDVTPILVKDQKKLIGFDEDMDAIFYPDAGAQKRYAKKIAAKNVLVGFKQRDFQTGRIESLQILGKEGFVPRKVIIADDLCSYGGTFLRSAEELKKLGVEEIHLCVTHCEAGIFQGGLYKSGLLKSIATTNSMPAFHNRFLSIPEDELKVSFSIFNILGGGVFDENYFSGNFIM